MEQEIKYTVAVSDNLDDFDTENYFLSPQYFYMHSVEELEKFLREMIVVHKKIVMVYQGKY